MDTYKNIYKYNKKSYIFMNGGNFDCDTKVGSCIDNEQGIFNDRETCINSYLCKKKQELLSIGANRTDNQNAMLKNIDNAIARIKDHPKLRKYNFDFGSEKVLEDINYHANTSERLKLICKNDICEENYNNMTALMQPFTKARSIVQGIFLRDYNNGKDDEIPLIIQLLKNKLNFDFEFMQFNLDEIKNPKEVILNYIDENRVNFIYSYVIESFMEIIYIAKKY